MSLTLRSPSRYGSLLPVPPTRLILPALALTLACARGPSLAEFPSDRLHFPAWLAHFTDPTRGDQLLVVNLDQDLAYQDGSLLSLQLPPVANPSVTGSVGVPNLAGQLLVLDGSDPLVAGCNFTPNGPAQPNVFTPSVALVAGRLDNNLYAAPLQDGLGKGGMARGLDLEPSGASNPFAVGFSCSADGTPRAWVSYLQGLDDVGYVTQVNLAPDSNGNHPVVQVNVGLGLARSFAYDPAHDRLYFTGRENSNRAPLRWIAVGDGCKTFDNGIQDERQGGCHVDPGWDLGAVIRGAEASDLALSSAEFPCTAGGFTGNCRRAYLSVRMYDPDLAVLLGGRPVGDIGGKLLVVELPEGGLGGPVPQIVGQFDIGIMAGQLQVIPRTGKHDLVAVTAIDDHLLWLYDDELGAMVKVFGRTEQGLLPLGHRVSGLASQDQGNGNVWLYVSSYQDHWVSVVNVPLDDPDQAAVLLDSTGNSCSPGVSPCYLHLQPGVAP